MLAPMDAVDNQVRLHVYERFVETGRPPTAEETSRALGLTTTEAEQAYRRLEAARVLVLAPGTTNVWLAQPLCATPTSFRVSTPGGAFWGTCAWDAFGVVAMLGGTGTVSTHCPDCNEPMELEVEGGELRPAEGVAHFVEPARRWWENIVFT
jgi:hypothetical protein